MIRKNYYRHGQASLIALLVLTIATTVGLSLVARSTTDISITRNLEESARAFSAAEAGVESVLRTGVASSGSLAGQLGTSYDVEVATIDSPSGVPYVFPRKTEANNTETVWLTSHNVDGSIQDSTPVYTNSGITICWGDEATTPALLVTVVYRESSDATGNPYRVAKLVSDPDNRIPNDTAPNADPQSCSSVITNAFRNTINFSTIQPSLNPTVDTLIALRIRPIYAQAQIAVIPNQDLPSQGFEITSEGQTPSGVTRRILVYQEYKAPSSLFDAAVFSETLFKHP